MTALCGGGSSGPKVGVDIALTYGSARIIQLLAQRGLSSFSPVVALLGTIPVIVSGFCTSDPPTMSTMTSDEADALLNLRFGTDFFSGLGKLKDIVLNLIWLDICQCTSGSLTEPTLPITPTDAPVYVPPSYEPTLSYGGFYPMRAVETKVLALGGGTTTYPTGWYSEAFDDSAWVTGVQPALTAGDWNDLSGGQSSTKRAVSQFLVVPVENNLPGPLDLVAPASPMPHNYEQFLVRWRVYIGNVVPARATIRTGSKAIGGQTGWSSGQVYVGGTSNVAPLGAVDGGFLSTRIVPNAWNLFAIGVNPSNTGNVDTWGTEGGIYLGLDWTNDVVNPNVNPCCPPDPTTQALLDAILAMVTLVQRQSAPFSYVYGDDHTGLTGNGSFGVSGILGVSVDVTTLPGNYGQDAGTPTQLYDVGFVTLGTADGYSTSRRIDHDGTLLLPPAAGAYTTVGYTLSPGVQVSIRELIREP